ncbi:hypothetical protein YC2023_065684 [Brassica napus]
MGLKLICVGGSGNVNVCEREDLWFRVQAITSLMVNIILIALGDQFSSKIFFFVTEMARRYKDSVKIKKNDPYPTRRPTRLPKLPSSSPISSLTISDSKPHHLPSPSHISQDELTKSTWDNCCASSYASWCYWTGFEPCCFLFSFQ